MVLAAPFAAVAGLLALAGALKLLRRGEQLGGTATRAGALLELALGVAAVVAPGRLLAALVALAFAAFAGYSLRLAATGGADCGCFGAGETDERVGPGHVALDLAACAVAAAAAVEPPRALASLVADAPAQGVALVAAVAASVYAIYLAYTALPRAWRAYAGVPQA